MIKNIITFSALMVTGIIAGAQTLFFSTVKVDFEKRIAVPNLYKEIDPEWYARFKERFPASYTSYFEFIGDSTRSVYKPGKEAPYDPRSWFQPFADQNNVYNDYSKGMTITQKPIFEETFLVEDSLHKIKWKITPDTRLIAGFECRKAIGILNDTIGIFAFYTEELMIPGGPEGITGLPGMILGMAIPRLHTTWFATSVQVNGVSVSSIVPPRKGKKVNRSSMNKSLTEAMGRWGARSAKMLMFTQI